MNNAVCLGNTEVEVNPGYWRMDMNTTDIIDCPREVSCSGGYNNTSEHPVD